MKKLVLLMLLCTLGIVASAQKIRNNTNCTVSVQPLCYDPVTCTTNPCPALVSVAAGGTALVPVCGCVLPALQGYVVCVNGTLCSACNTVGDALGPWPCPNFPAAAGLGCSRCSVSGMPITISWNAAGDLVIQ